MPVSQTGRRSSSSGFNLLSRGTPDKNNNSMAGFYASEQQQRTPLVSMNEQRGLQSALGSKSPRLSLSEKIKAIKLNAGGSAGAVEKGPASAIRRPSQLLSPDFFSASLKGGSGEATTPATPPTDRKVVRRGSFVREPEGPDGTKGFGRRRSSVDAGMLPNAVAILG